MIWRFLSSFSFTLILEIAFLEQRKPEKETLAEKQREGKKVHKEVLPHREVIKIKLLKVTKIQLQNEYDTVSNFKNYTINCVHLLNGTCL